MDAVQSVVNEIVRWVRPLRIILFGSTVKGRAHADSDIDLLVVVPNSVDRQRILDTIYTHVHATERPYDVVVATPRLLEEHKDNIGLIYYEILKTGRVVYAS